MVGKKVKTGFVAAQYFNQMHWSSDPNEQGYKKHGLESMEAKDARGGCNGKRNVDMGWTFEKVDGVVDILGGDWQNAVYKVTLYGDDDESDNEEKKDS